MVRQRVWLEGWLAFGWDVEGDTSWWPPFAVVQLDSSWVPVGFQLGSIWTWKATHVGRYFTAACTHLFRLFLFLLPPPSPSTPQKKERVLFGLAVV
jgi:hypothetical protein